LTNLVVPRDVYKDSNSRGRRLGCQDTRMSEYKVVMIYELGKNSL